MMLPPRSPYLAERVIEHAIFASRWLLAPIYMGLIGGLVVLLIKFVQKMDALVRHVLTTDGANTIIGVLGLVDLALMGGLVLMVMFSGYESFVSKMNMVDSADKPKWMGYVGFGDLKLKLMASIVAISAIHVLEDFMNLEHVSDRVLAWSVGIHMAFVVSGLLLALMDRLSGSTEGGGKTGG